MKKLMFGLLVFGLATQFMFSQVFDLPEVNVAVNYKYLDAISSAEVPALVKQLEEEVAYFNFKESDFYNEKDDTFSVAFYIPEGKILAIYNKVGEIVSTRERFINIKLPRQIMRSIIKNYSDWTVVEDSYRVNYNGQNGNVNKQYRVKLKNEKDTKVVKLTENGDIL